MINELLNIKYPIFQGAMANIATPEFAAAASEAGCLGIIATGAMGAEEARAAVRRCKALTDKPFGVNIMLMNPEADAIAAMLVEERVAAVTTGAGNPGKYLKAFKAANIRVFPVVASVALARRLARDGADGIIAEGTESGGHVGEITTMALVPQIAQAVDVPVIAAGGIATGRQLNAALCLGAQGVQVGTCLLLADECPIHDNYKQAVVRAKDRDTVVTGRSLGAPVRILKNQMTSEYLSLERQGADRDAMEALTLGGLRRAVFEGDVKNGSVMMGQVAAMCKDRRPLAEIVDALMTEARAEISGIEAKWAALGMK